MNPWIAKAKAMADFMKWALTDGQKFTQDLGYAPLPDEVVTHVSGDQEVPPDVLVTLLAHALGETWMGQQIAHPECRALG